jgi:hypothetical protein
MTLPFTSLAAELLMRLAESPSAASISRKDLLSAQEPVRLAMANASMSKVARQQCFLTFAALQPLLRNANCKAAADASAFPGDIDADLLARVIQSIKGP